MGGDNVPALCGRYLEFFPAESHNRTKTVFFEKSANYFDASLAPMRVGTLLPHARIISTLIDPGLRAYSWYQVSSERCGSWSVLYVRILYSFRLSLL